MSTAPTSLNKIEERIIDCINYNSSTRFLLNLNPEDSAKGRKRQESNIKKSEKFKDTYRCKSSDIDLSDIHSYKGDHPAIKQMVALDDTIYSMIDDSWENTPPITVDDRTNGLATVRLLRTKSDLVSDDKMDTFLKNYHMFFETKFENVFQLLYAFRSSVMICIGDISKKEMIPDTFRGTIYYSKRLSKWINIHELVKPLAMAPSVTHFDGSINRISNGKTVVRPIGKEPYASPDHTSPRGKKFIDIMSQYINAHERGKIDHSDEWCVMYQYIDNYNKTGSILGDMKLCVGIVEDDETVVNNSPMSEFGMDWGDDVSFRVVQSQYVIGRPHKNTKLEKTEDNDKFYTQEDVVVRMWDVVKEKVDLSTIDMFIEPSAGDGAIIKHLPEGKSKGYDLVPEDKGTYGIIEHDFLTTNGNGEDEHGSVMYVGNPPFGFACSLAIPFFNHCADNKDAKYIVFIIPRTFRKVSVQNKLSLNFSLLYEENVKNNAFLLNGEPYDVPCMFQIWERTETPRQKVETPDNIWFDLMKTEEECDFCVRRTGGRAGKVIPKTGSITPSSTHLIKCKEGYENLQEVIESIDFSHIAEATAGIKSVSITELLLELDKYYKGENDVISNTEEL